MSEVNDSRFCPVCENIVPREEKGVLVKISPARTVLLHGGCASKIVAVVAKEVTEQKRAEDNDEV